jgi:hypothetical protein
MAEEIALDVAAAAMCHIEELLARYVKDPCDVRFLCEQLAPIVSAASFEAVRRGRMSLPLSTTN